MKISKENTNPSTNHSFFSISSLGKLSKTLFKVWAVSAVFFSSLQGANAEGVVVNSLCLVERDAFPGGTCFTNLDSFACYSPPTPTFSNVLNPSFQEAVFANIPHRQICKRASQSKMPSFIEKPLSTLYELFFNLDQKSEEDVEKTFLEAHAQMFKGAERYRPGKYRNEKIEVPPNFRENSLDDFLKVYKRRGGKTPEFVRSFYRKGKQGLPPSALSKEEKKAITDASYIPPSPEKIPGLMKDFSKELLKRFKKIKCGDQDQVIEFASWFKYGLVKIHPFSNGNGTFSRAVLNVILKIANMDPVIFSQRTSYERAFGIRRKMAKRVESLHYNKLKELIKKEQAEKRC